MANPSDPQLRLSLGPTASPRGSSAAALTTDTTCAATPALPGADLLAALRDVTRTGEDMRQAVSEAVLSQPASWQAFAARGDVPGDRTGATGRGQEERYSPYELSTASKAVMAQRTQQGEGATEMRAMETGAAEARAAGMRAAETSALASLLQWGGLWEAAAGDLPSIAGRLRQHEGSAPGAPRVSCGPQDNIPSLLQQIQHSLNAHRSSLLASPAAAGTPLVYPGLVLQGSACDTASEALPATCLQVPRLPGSDAAQGPAPGVPTALSSHPHLRGTAASERNLESLVRGVGMISSVMNSAIRTSSVTQGVPHEAPELAELMRGLAPGTPSGSHLGLLMAQLRTLHHIQTQGSSSLPASGLSPPPLPALPHASAPDPSPVPSPASVSFPALSPPAPTSGLTPAALAAASALPFSGSKQEPQESGRAGSSLRESPARGAGAEFRSRWDHRFELNEHPAEHLADQPAEHLVGEQGTASTRLSDSQLGPPEEHATGQQEGDPRCAAEAKGQGSTSPQGSDSQGRGKRGRVKNEEVSGEGSGDGEEGGVGREQKKLRLSRDEQEMLDRAFQRQPRPSQREKEGIARALHATIRQMEVWFQNRRARSKIKESAKELEALKLRCEGLERQNKKLGAELAKAVVTQLQSPAVSENVRRLRGALTSMVVSHPVAWPVVVLPMTDCGTLVARTGRSHQRYEDGYRLVAGCIPYRFRPNADGTLADARMDAVEVLMITSQHGQGLLFPKGGWETDETAEEAACREAMEEAGVRGRIQVVVGTYEFRSKRLRTELCKEGACRAHVFAMAVTEQLERWPEQEKRSRYWLPLPEAMDRCRHDWMRDALQQWVDSLRAQIPG